MPGRLEPAVNDSHLQAALERVACRYDIGQVEVAYWEGPVRAHAFHSRDSASAGTQKEYSAHVACLTKALTATMVAEAFAAGFMQLHQSVASLLGLDDARLALITAAHALSHTTGLDVSATEAVRRGPSGMIDVAHLRELLIQDPAMAPPGELFSSNEAGGWIGSAVLERIHGRPYIRLLQEQLFEPLGIEALLGQQPLAEVLARWPRSAARNDADPGAETAPWYRVCPAFGGELRLSARGLLTFLELHLAKNVRACAALRSHSYELPGWRPAVRRVCLGWNLYGDDWFGHNANLNGDSVVVRFSPDRGVAIAITAAQPKAAFITLASLFAGRFKDVVPPGDSFPKRMSEEAWSRVDASQYAGTYQNAGLAIEFSLVPSLHLRARLSCRRARAGYPPPQLPREYGFLPASDDVFFCEEPDALVPFVQFLDRDGTGTFRYIHDGRQVFPRAGVAQPRS